MLAVSATLQPNIQPQSDLPLSTKTDFDVFARSASAIRDNEKCSIVTYRKSTTSFQLVPKSVTLNDLKWRNDHYVALFLYNFKPRYGRAVLLAIRELLVRNLHIAVARIFSINSAYLFVVRSAALSRHGRTRIFFTFTLCNVYPHNGVATE